MHPALRRDAIELSPQARAHWSRGRHSKTDLFAVGTAAGTSVHLVLPNAAKTHCGRPAVPIGSLGSLELNGCVRCRRSALDEGPSSRDCPPPTPASS